MAKNNAKKVNRTELIEALANELGFSKAQAERCLNGFVTVVTKKLSGGYDVNITGFGVFRVVTRAARKGVNPKTGAAIQIPKTTSVAYKVGKTLKESVKK